MVFLSCVHIIISILYIYIYIYISSRLLIWMRERNTIKLHVQGDQRESDVFEMISTHLFFNEKAILLQKNLCTYMPFELHIMNER